MSERPHPTASTRPSGRKVEGAVAFGIAIVIVVAAGLVGHAFAWVEKLPVPWPEGLQIAPGFRNLQLPNEAGPYRAAQDGDKYYDHTGRLDGADNIVDAKDLDTLGIGRKDDQRRFPQRRSNWYASRQYIDTRKNDGEPFQWWRLNVYYYTGVRDAAPHVGEICIIAGGGIIDERKIVSFGPWPALRTPWHAGADFKRIGARTYANDGTRRRQVEYYVFVVNDRPMSDRLKVKNFLNRLTVTYSYFAKVQFSPFEIGDADAAAIDQAAEDFIGYLMPAVLDMMPTTDAIERLEETGNQAGNGPDAESKHGQETQED